MKQIRHRFDIPTALYPKLCERQLFIDSPQEFITAALEFYLKYEQDTLPEPTEDMKAGAKVGAETMYKSLINKGVSEKEARKRADRFGYEMLIGFRELIRDKIVDFKNENE